MPKNIDWFAVFDSVIYMWLPFVIILAVIIGYFIFRAVKYNKNKQINLIQFCCFRQVHTAPVFINL